jgi:MFS family permease
MPRVKPSTPVRFSAPVDAVAAAAREHLGARPEGDGLRVGPAPGEEPGIALILRCHADGRGSVVSIESGGDAGIPFFGFFLRPLFAIARRRAGAHAIATLRHALEGAPEPRLPKIVPGLPPVAFTREQATLLATASAATAVVTFASSLFGQLNNQIAATFGASDARISVALATTRVGALFALFATALADRRGRRMSIMIGVIGSSVACGISAIAPSLGVLTAAQILQRAFVITTATVAGIAVIEEAPEGARAYAASMLALAGGFGFSMAVIALPFADIGDYGWRIPFGLGVATIFLARPIARHLAETARYTAVAARADVVRGRIREVLDRRYGRRFALLALVAFLTSMFSAPSSQLMNKYLEDVRGFSSTGTALFRTLTTGVPGLIGVLVGGRLAEARGRRPVAAIGLAIATASQMAFFLMGGAVIWLMSAVSVLAAGAGGIALGTLDVELFPTEVRSTSNALLTVVAVTGSIGGLVMAGGLSEPLGNIGRSIALTGVATLLAALFVVPRLPESAARSLDDVSPTETGFDP